MYNTVSFFFSLSYAGKPEDKLKHSELKWKKKKKKKKRQIFNLSLKQKKLQKNQINELVINRNYMI